MEDFSLPQQLLQQGKLLRQKPIKCFKDVNKNNLGELNIYIGDWEQMTINWSTSKKVIYESGKAFEVYRIE